MAVDERLQRARGPGTGLGLLKGMLVTLKHLFKHNTVIEYPDEKQDLSPRTRGVIALKEENCTVCMLCARECPDWCIYIDSHKESLPPKRAGGRPRKRNILDRFAIDYALCMYCGICVDVCPYDALFWSREFEFAEYDIREMTHEKERLSDWMATVLPPPPLEAGAELPGTPAPAAPAAPAQPAATAAPAAPPAAPAAPPTVPSPKAEPPEPAPRAPKKEEAPTPTKEEAPPSPALTPQERGPNVEVPHEAPRPVALAHTEDPAAVYKQVLDEQLAKGSSPQVAEARARVARVKAERGIRRGPTPIEVDKPHEGPRPVALAHTEDAEAAYKQVLDEQLGKGSSPQVAEARARVARVKAERGIRRGPTPIEVDKPVPSAPTKGELTEPAPGGAPKAKEPEPKQGPVAPTGAEDKPKKGPKEPPPDIGEEEEGPLVEPGEPRDTGETVPDKIVETVTGEPQSDDDEKD